MNRRTKVAVEGIVHCNTAANVRIASLMDKIGFGLSYAGYTVYLFSYIEAHDRSRMLLHAASWQTLVIPRNPWTPSVSVGV